MYKSIIKPKFVHCFMLLLGLTSLTSACLPPGAGGSPASTPAPGFLETAIHETAAAAQTQTALFLPPTQTVTYTPTPSKTPTQTPSPTSTILFLFPTHTQVVLPTLTFVSSVGSGSGSGKPTRTPNPNEHDYTGSLRCALVGQTPPDGTVIGRRKKFTVVWTVKNTGTAAWRKHIIDYRYVAGDKFHKRDRYNMNFIVDPGETIDMSVEMNAPKEPGSYETVWVVGLNKGSMCSMSLSIIVR